MKLGIWLSERYLPHMCVALRIPQTLVGMTLKAKPDKHNSR